MSAAQLYRILDRSQLIVIGVAVGMLACFIGLVCIPDHRSLKKIGAELETTEQLMVDLRTEAVRLPDISEQVAGLKERHMQHLVCVPQESNLAEFLGTVADILKSEGITQREVVPQRPRVHPEYYELPITMAFDSSFPSAFAVLARLEQMERVTRVESTQFSSLPQTNGRVQVEIQMVIYHTRTASEGPVQVAGGTGGARG